MPRSLAAVDRGFEHAVRRAREAHVDDAISLGGVPRERRHEARRRRDRVAVVVGEEHGRRVDARGPAIGRSTPSSPTRIDATAVPCASGRGAANGTKSRCTMSASAKTRGARWRPPCRRFRSYSAGGADAAALACSSSRRRVAAARVGRRLGAGRIDVIEVDDGAGRIERELERRLRDVAILGRGDAQQHAIQARRASRRARMLKPQPSNALDVLGRARE